MGFKICGMEEEIQINPGGSTGSIVNEVEGSKGRVNNAIPGAYLSDKTNVTNVKHSGHASLGPELVNSWARGSNRMKVWFEFSACAWEMIWDKRSGSGGKT